MLYLSGVRVRLWNIKKQTQKVGLLLAGIIVSLSGASTIIPSLAHAAGVYHGEYWNLDPSTGVAPGFPTGAPTFTHDDSDLNFEWDFGSPDVSINSDHFAARWTKTDTFEAGTYRFLVASDDGIRVYIDNNLVINRWTDQGIDNHAIFLTMTAGTHNIKVEYYEDAGWAGVSLSYAKVTLATDLLGASAYDMNAQNDDNVDAAGFEEPYATAVDTVHHRLFVADGNANRVTVFNLNSSDQLVDKTADLVLGQADMFHDGSNREGVIGANTLNNPHDVAYDSAHDRVFVADSNNNRVLVYNLAGATNGMNASFVLGEPDMTSFLPDSVSASLLNFPTGLVYDSTRQLLFVADQDNNRVLIFDVSSITNGMPAVHELGQVAGPAAFTSNAQECGAGTAASTFCVVQRLYFDSVTKRLFVSDNAVPRVMIFDTTTITDGMDAVHVLGQANLTSAGFAGPGDANFGDPRAIAYDPTHQRLFVTDAGVSGFSRVMVFDANPSSFTDGESALHVLGQANFTNSSCNTGGLSDMTLCGPYGVGFDATTGLLYVADTQNDRVVSFNTATLTDGQAATDLIGQVDFTVDNSHGVPQPNAHGLDLPDTTVLDTVDHHLFVADFQNSRVLEYNLDSHNRIADHTAAYVLGQPDFFTNDSCGDGTTFCNVTGLALDTTNHILYVSDVNHSRVLLYQLSNSNTIVHPEVTSAIGVLGQADTNSASTDCNRGVGPDDNTLCGQNGLSLDSVNHRLFVADSNNNRVMAFDLNPDGTPVDGTASFVLGKANFTDGTGCTPSADCTSFVTNVTVDPVNHHLYVADTSNNRVLRYDLNSNGTPVDTTADAVLGQPDMASTDCNLSPSFVSPTADTLCAPSGIVLDTAGQRLIVSDTINCRVVIYNTDAHGVPQDTTADAVLGQPDFVTNEPFHTDQSSLFGPTGGFIDPGLAYDAVSHQLFVPDTFNNRVMVFTLDADIDGDGIANAAEEGAPNGGDANNDGTPDDLEADVTSFVDVVSDKYAVLQSTCSSASGVDAEAESSSHPDKAFNYPAGLMTFTLNCGTPGVTATVTQYFYGSLQASQVVVRKFNPNTNTYISVPGAVVTNVTTGGQSAIKVVYHVKDGGPLDFDGTANGTIVDPAGPAVNAAGAPNTGVGGMAAILARS